MITHNVQQGSDAWRALRTKHNTASEASAMMGASDNVTRSELIHMKATGSEREFSEFVQARILDNGHVVEALARPIAEKIIGEDLYSATVSDDEGYLLASLDGGTIMDNIIWEHKQINAKKIAAVNEGRVPDCDYWQVVQALRITGAEKCLYMVSDGTEDNCHYIWVTLNEADSAKLLAGWKQFDADVAAYVPTEVKPAAIGRTPETLPALHINVTGMVTASNLDEYKSHALDVIESINTNLQTDQDFADAEKAVKWLKDVADNLKAAKQHALSQTESIDALFRAIDDMVKGADTKRLSLGKLVDAEKINRRTEILQKGQQAIFSHMAELNASLGGKIKLPNIVADFAGVMKNKRTIESLKNAVDTELARVKIEASQIATAYGINLATLRDSSAGYEFLFSDAQQIISKANDDLVLLINARITEHKATEATNIEAEVQRKLAIEREAVAAAARQTEAAHRKAQENLNAGQTAITESNREEVKSVVTAAITQATTEKPVEQIKQAKPKSTRPSDAQLCKAICLQFDVPESMADAWLREYGFVSAA